MPNTFTTPGTTVRKVDITQVFNAWTSGSATYGVPVNMAVSSSLTALKIRQNGAGNIAEFLKSDGSVVFSIDNAGAVTGLSFAAGSETNPSVYLAGDTDTGFWQPDVDEIAVSIAGVKKLHLADGSLEFLDTILINQGTLTSDAQGIRQTAVWDEGTTTFTSMEVVITDNDSASASLLLDLQCGASPATVFSIRKDGRVTAAGGIAVTGNSTIAGTLGSLTGLTVNGDSVLTGASGGMTKIKSAATGDVALRIVPFNDTTPTTVLLGLTNAAESANTFYVQKDGTVGTAFVLVTDGSNGVVQAAGSTGDLYLRPKTGSQSVRFDSGTVAVSGVLAVSAGSVGSPAITTAGDTNTGIYFPSADVMNLVTGGTTRLNFDTVHISITPGSGGSFKPSASNAYDLGIETDRWRTVYSQNALNTSRREYKQDITPLDTATALDVVLRTPIYTYAYKTKPDRPCVGFIADDADPLLSPDHEFADAATSVGIAFAAIQVLADRMSALEAS